MFSAPSTYLQQTAPACSIPGWSLNKAIERAMKHTKIERKCEPEFFADTEVCQFSPWPMHEKLAFGRDLLPNLIRSLEATRRTKYTLQLLRSLLYLLPDPDHCSYALQLNILKPLTTTLMSKTFDVKVWSLACIRIIAGNVNGKASIVQKSLIMNEIRTNFTSSIEIVHQMAFTTLYRLTENWFVVPDLQKQGWIKVVIETLFALTEGEVLSDHDKCMTCLLETLANLIDNENGVLKAISYDLFDLHWLLCCGLKEVEKSMLKVFACIARDEIGRLGLRCKGVAENMLNSFYSAVHDGYDPTLLGATLMFSTLPNVERIHYVHIGAVDVIMDIFRLPNVSSATRLVLLMILMNMAELDEGRTAIKKNLQTLITIQICSPLVRSSVNALIEKIFRPN